MRASGAPFRLRAPLRCCDGSYDNGDDNSREDTQKPLTLTNYAPVGDSTRTPERCRRVRSRPRVAFNWHARRCRTAAHPPTGRIGISSRACWRTCPRRCVRACPRACSHVAPNYWAIRGPDHTRSGPERPDRPLQRLRGAAGFGKRRRGFGPHSERKQRSAVWRNV